jgi:hypothetical protein
MSEAFDLENRWLASADVSRLAKFIDHWTVYEDLLATPGDVVEVGVLKGGSLLRWLTYREMTGGNASRKVVAFDSFGAFPESAHPADQAFVKRFVADAGESLSVKQLRSVLREKGLNKNVELVEGDVCETVPTWCITNPERRVALLHIDVDTLLPTKTTLENLGNRVAKGGVIVLDDFGKFPGETEAWEEFNESGEWELRKLPHHTNVCVARRIRAASL